MAKLGINTGSAPDAGDGDSLLAGGIKINSNFNEVYSYFGDGNNLNSGTWNKTTTGINTLGRVGIGTTNSTSSLSILGDVLVSGIVTASSFVGNVSYASSSGISTSVVGGNASVINLNVSGIATLGVTSATNLTIQQINVSGISTLGITSTTNLTTQQINVSGVSTFNNNVYVGTAVTINASSGIISATRFDGIINDPNFEVIDEDLQLYVATTGSDTTGTGTLANPWATPHKAVNWLSSRTIKLGIGVTINIADGNYTFTEELVLEHPNGNQIKIFGGTTTGVRPVETLTGSSTGIETGNTSASKTYNVGLLTSFYNTVLRFNGTNGLRCNTNGGTTLDRILIIGDGTTPFCNGVCVGVSDDSASGMIGIGTSVAVHNFSSNGVLSRHGSYVFAQNVTVTNCNNGFACLYGGNIRNGSALASNCNGDGFRISNGGTIRGFAGRSHYNGGSGFSIVQGGSLDIVSSSSTSNTGAGVSVRYGGSVGAKGLTASRNVGGGVTVRYGGYFDLTSSTITNNAPFDIYGFGSGTIYVGGSTYSTISPTLNTVGNGSVYITNT